MNTILVTFKNLLNFIDQLNSQSKTIIIFILFAIILLFFMKKSNETILSDYLNKLEQIDKKADKYTIEIAPKMHECVTAIQKEDPDCYNVLLLNYHNSKKSLQGLRYLYLNCIVESPKGINDEQVKEYWSDLEYIYYQDELSKIHNQGYLRIEDIDSIKFQFPKLYKKLYISEAKSAALYPIEGIENPIGMIIVLYKQPKKYNLGFYNAHVSPQIQKLSTLLDYPNLKINK